MILHVKTMYDIGDLSLSLSPRYLATTGALSLLFFFFFFSLPSPSLSCGTLQVSPGEFLILLVLSQLEKKSQKKSENVLFLGIAHISFLPFEKSLWYISQANLEQKQLKFLL